MNDRGIIRRTDITKRFCEMQSSILFAEPIRSSRTDTNFCGTQLVTLFSAPNYCGEFDNGAGMMVVKENLMFFEILKVVT